MKKMLLLLLAISSAPALFGKVDVRARMEQDVEFIVHNFEIKYAPFLWKVSYADWDLYAERDRILAQMRSLRNPTVKQCQHLIKSFFNSAKDYHVGVNFYSTEEATLPFAVKRIGEKYYLSYVHRGRLPSDFFPFERGDEVLSFDGRPIAEVVNEIKREELGGNTPATDQAFAELILTQRDGMRGDKMPHQESVEVSFLRNGVEESYFISWDHTSEQLLDPGSRASSPPKRKMMVAAALPKKREIGELIRKEPILKKAMVAASWPSFASHREVDGEEIIHEHSMGTKRSCLPSLGRKVWRNEDYFSPFDAYIFEMEGGQRVGYVRIPHYLDGEEGAMSFAAILSFFEEATDGLVIDQLNNPGGSVFYLYALASMLIGEGESLPVPMHRIALTQEEVFSALTILPLIEGIADDYEARDLLGETLDGYPVDYSIVEGVARFCRQVIQEWNAGHILTEPMPLFGVSEITSYPYVHYTKPIVILINQLDFSGGDFFPAILQDSGRAVLFGERTAGAGGFVIPTTFFNQLGIAGFQLTGSLAERPNGDPIENLGVNPDVVYSLTERDIRENYREYTAALHKVLRDHIG